MEGNPAVSVIVPVYNVEIYIKQCVDSILNQTFQDFEVILVDDVSPDDSIALCQKLYGDNDKIKIVRHEKNLGLGEARNTGIKNARGKYVYFVDSDDFILPDALDKFYNAAEKFKMLTAFFGNKMSFVKFLFNGFHTFRRAKLGKYGKFYQSCS